MTDSSRRTLDRIAARVPVPDHAYERQVALQGRRQRHRKVSAVVMAAVIALLGSAGLVRVFHSSVRPAQPVPAPTGEGIFEGLGGWIVYTDPLHPNGLWAVDPADGRVIQLSTRNASPQAWTPDGARLLLLTGLTRGGGDAGPGGRALSFWNSDGSSTPLVSAGDHTYLSDASISPDGKTVLYIESSMDGSRANIVVMGVEGVGKTQLTQSGHVFDPAFSPDGSQIAYMEWKKGFDYLWLMDADGSNARSLGRVPPVARGGMGWSPGRLLAFSSVSGISLADPPLLVSHPGGPFITPQEVITVRYPAWEPMWSPDGTKLEYLSSRNPEGRGVVHLTIADADGTHVRTYDAYPGPWNPLPRTQPAAGTTGAAAGIPGSALVIPMVALALSVIGFASFARRRRDGYRSPPREA